MKIAYSGTHGTGKTTSAFEKCLDVKMNHSDVTVTIVNEIARRCPFPINKDVTSITQLWLVNKQINEEIVASSLFDVVICDRTVMDYLAYTSLVSKDLYKRLLPMVEYHASSYDLITVKTIEENDYMVDDGTRSLDTEFRKEVENALMNIYINELKLDNVVWC